MNMSKSRISAYFRHVFANNFFGTFFKTFKRIWYFFQTLKPNAQKTAQKNGKPFLQTCLRI